MEDGFLCEECGELILVAPAWLIQHEGHEALQCLVCCTIYTRNDFAPLVADDPDDDEDGEAERAYYREMESDY